MLITDEALRSVDDHWAVQAVGLEGRSRGLRAAEAHLVRDALGSQVRVDFVDDVDDEALIERLALAYEVAALEGIDATLYPSTAPATETEQLRCQAGAWRAFELRRMLSIRGDDDARIFAVLHLAGLAYASERWSDLRRWIDEHPDAVVVPDIADTSWDRRLLHRIFDCWVRLLRKRSWDDLTRIAVLVTTLRAEQAVYEKTTLSANSDAAKHAMALRLISLYHWAKASELLATYMMQGTPSGITEELDKHFEQARKAAHASHDAALEMVLHWLHVSARRMVTGSVWWVAHRVNSRVTKFVQSVTKSQALFELLPPQRAAIQEQGLLDQAHRAIVVELPTSGGKTLLAEFRILQALNQFAQDGGWVAYVAPTKALVSQITRRLRRDFSPFGIVVEQLTGAVDIDSFEEDLLSATGDQKSFDVLVATTEKLQIVLRNKRVPRPLALIVMDEAHNLEDGERGMRVELLLATIRRECEKANFLLLMPFVPNGADLAKWLSPDSGKSVSIGTSPWKPNDRVVGLFSSVPGVAAGDWSLQYETVVTTSQRALKLHGVHAVDGNRPLGLSKSNSSSAISQTAAIAAIMSARGTSIAIANQIPRVWSMARTIAKSRTSRPTIAPEIQLVQRFLATEISPEFELIAMLAKGVGVHHAGLSDETRILMEWLAEEGHLDVLCATTTINQGLNFPVSSVFLSGTTYTLSHPPYQQHMSPREFWNLAGRAGRVGHDSVGVVGIAAGNNPEDIKRFLARSTEALVSRLVQLLDQLYDRGRLNELEASLAQDDWRAFRSYVAHLWAEKNNIDLVLADSEQLLRHTFGYVALRSQRTPAANAKADALLDVTKKYVRKLAEHPENASLADSTGFAPEGVRSALLGLDQLESKLKLSDWEPTSLFGQAGSSALPSLIGVMLKIPELRNSLEEITGSGLDFRNIAEITMSWVNGDSINDIARKYFNAGPERETESLTDACKAIYRTLVNAGPWGISALTKMPTSGLNFEDMPDDVRRRLNSLPAMIYHGVHSEAAVLMRMNAVPRSIAENLGDRFSTAGTSEATIRGARDFIRSMKPADWDASVPKGASMTGTDFRDVWRRLSGNAGE